MSTSRVTSTYSAIILKYSEAQLNNVSHFCKQIVTENNSPELHSEDSSQSQPVFPTCSSTPSPICLLVSGRSELSTSCLTNVLQPLAHLMPLLQCMPIYQNSSTFLEADRDDNSLIKSCQMSCNPFPSEGHPFLLSHLFEGNEQKVSMASI